MEIVENLKEFLNEQPKLNYDLDISDPKNWTDIMDGLWGDVDVFKKSQLEFI